MSQPSPLKDTKFSDLGLSAKLLAHLTKLNFITPTPIQLQAIPAATKGQDVIGIAQTGTGKTLAFALPALEQIMSSHKQALIILPTRELAMQVVETIQQVGRPFDIRHALLIGGASMGQQIQAIRRQPQFIVATPGRLIDHMQSKNISLHKVGVLVLDEADRMLDMGFAPQINQILNAIPKDRQTLLFSATMPPQIRTIATRHMKNPVQVNVAPSGTVADRVDQKLFVVNHDQKNRLLDKLLTDYGQTILVFSRTKHGAKRICRVVRQMKHSAAEIHSNLSLSQRKRSLEGFKSGKFRVLVATDIAARGIDVSNIELVINYDLPDNLDDYVHRVGRTGRAGQAGQAISFVTPDQRGKIRGIERLVRKRLEVTPLPELPAHRPQLNHTEERSDYRDNYRSKYPRSNNRRPSRSSHGQSNTRSDSRPPSRQKKRVRTHF